MTALTSMPVEQLTDQTDPKKNFLRRNAGLMTGVGLFVTTWMLVYTFAVYKPSYAAKSVVMIRDSAINTRYVESDQYYVLPTTSSSSSNPVLNTMGILKSGAISDALWQYFKTKHPEELKKSKLLSRQKWDAFFQDGSAFIKAKNQAGTDLISVQFSWEKPIIAREGLTTILAAFQDASRDINRAEQSTRIHFLDKQVAEIEKQLADVRKAKSNFQSKQKTVSVKQESDGLAGTRLELANRLNQLESLARGKERFVERYQQLVGLTPKEALHASALGQNETMAQLQNELYRLQQQASNLSASLTDNNPKVKEVQAQIQQVKANIAAEIQRTMPGSQVKKAGVVADGTRGEMIKSMLSAYGEAQDLRAQAGTIRARLNQVNLEISQFPEKAEGLSAIEQKEASLSIALDHLRQKALEARIKEEQTLSNVFVVDAPRLPDKPQAPNQKHLLILSVFLGLASGLTAGIAREQWRNRSNNQNQSSLHPNNWWTTPLDPSMDSVVASTQEPHLPEAQPQPLPAIAVNPTNIHPAWMQPHPEWAPPAENPQSPLAKKELAVPVSGTGTDELIARTGPINTPTSHPMTQPTLSPSRSDLTGPLQEDSLSALHVASAITAQANSAFSIETTPAASTVRVAQPLTDSQQLLVQEKQLAQPIQPLTEAELAGIPTLHAAPATLEDETGMAALEEIGATPEPTPAVNQTRPYVAYEEPISYKNPGLVNVEASPVQDMQPEETQPEALQLTENNQPAEAQPAHTPSRKLRSIPQFLLDNASGSGQFDIKNPYVLIPRKQLLDPTEDLMQDVAPMSAPSESAQIQEELPFPDLEAAANFRPRKSILKPLRFGKNPERHPEIYFGLGRKEKNSTLQAMQSAKRFRFGLDDQFGSQN